jgi:hypothetical protein
MPDQTKSFLNFMTVFISQVPDPKVQRQLEYALTRTQAMMNHDEHTLATLEPPPISKHVPLVS